MAVSSNQHSATSNAIKQQGQANWTNKKKSLFSQLQEQTVPFKQVYQTHKLSGSPEVSSSNNNSHNRGEVIASKQRAADQQAAKAAEKNKGQTSNADENNTLKKASNSQDQAGQQYDQKISATSEPNHSNDQKTHNSKEESYTSESSASSERAKNETSRDELGTSETLTSETKTPETKALESKTPESSQQDVDVARLSHGSTDSASFDSDDTALVDSEQVDTLANQLWTELFGADLTGSELAEQGLQGSALTIDDVSAALSAIGLGPVSDQLLSTIKDKLNQLSDSSVMSFNPEDEAIELSLGAGLLNGKAAGMGGVAPQDSSSYSALMPNGDQARYGFYREGLSQGLVNTEGLTSDPSDSMLDDALMNGTSLKEAISTAASTLATTSTLKAMQEAGGPGRDMTSLLSQSYSTDQLKQGSAFSELLAARTTQQGGEGLVQGLAAGVDKLSQAGIQLQLPGQGKMMVGRPEWHQAIAERTAAMASQRLTSAEIQLDPPELGQLQVRVTLQHDQANVTFVSPHAVVRDALDQTANRLREMFAGEGLNLVNVDVSGQSSQRGQGESSADQNSSSQGGSGQGNSDDTPTEPTALVKVNQGLVDQFV